MNRRQTIPKHLRFTINDFNAQCPDNDACLEWLKEKRYPAGLAFCEKCEKERKHHRVTGRPAYACDHCGKMISPMAGTIFEKSSTPLKTWFYAMYLMGSTRCGISAKQIQRETGVTYKTAWRMFHQIRKLMAEDLRLGGSGSSGVELDEMYHGGRRKNEAGRMLLGNKGKNTMVLGVVERKGRIVARATGDKSLATTNALVKEYVLPETVIFTDESPTYHQLPRLGYEHKRVNHSAKDRNSVM